MLALVKTAPGPGQVELRQVPEPAPKPDQVKLEVAAKVLLFPESEH